MSTVAAAHQVLGTVLRQFRLIEASADSSASSAAMYSESDPLLEQKTISDEPPEIRSGFIQKVYGILTVQLLLTALIAYPFVMDPSVKAWVRTKGLPLLILAIVLNLVFFCLMLCPCGCQENMRKVPLNYILLFGFTGTEGFLVGVICTMYTVDSVLFALLATSLLVGALTIYAVTTKTDFTTMGDYLFVGAIGLFICAIFLFIFPYPFMHKIYCCLGILLFSMYLIYDTQQIMGKGELKIGIDDYIYAALQLYIDIIQLFLYILQLFGDRE